jgi:tetratricopeptide (TPR) repeat protein
MNANQSSTPGKSGASTIKKKKRVRKPGTKSPLSFRIAITLIIFALILGMFKLWTCLKVTEPHLNYLDVTKNGEALVLLDGETARFHPGDRLRIIDISTNVCFNRGVRIVSEGMDANSLIYDEVLLSDLLPDKDVYSNLTFRLEVKRFNTLMGYVDLVIEPLVEDWLERAEGNIEGDKKIEVLKQALEVFPGERKVKDRLINEYISLQDWEDAAKILEGIVKEKPDQETYKTLLDVYEKMSSSIGVVSVLTRMIDLTPDDVNLKIKLADALSNAGRTADAIGVYEELLNSLTGQDLLSVYSGLGYLYAETGENEKAISSYLSALKLNDSDTNIYQNLYLLYEKTGRKDEANKYLARAIELKPDSQDDKLKLAGNLLEAGKLKEAERSVREFIKDNPKSMDAWLLMTNIAQKNGDKTVLKIAYEKILDINPRNNTVMYNLGVMEYEAGSQDKALSYLERYTKSVPDDGIAHSFLFEIYKAQKNEDMAYREASTAIKLKPDETECWEYVFEYLNKKQRYSDMVSIMEEGIEASPKDVNIRKYLIAAYLKTGKENQAIIHMKEALELAPKDTEMLMQLAKLYEKQNKPKEALDAYKKLLDINPDNEDAEEAYLRLRLKTIPK